MREITTEAQLRELVDLPTAAAASKERDRLDDVHRRWIAASPLVLVATSDAQGRLDVSPKGDPSDVAHVLDDLTLALPDRPGNRRLDGLRNVLVNPHAGLLFVVPGRGDTLRVNGRARVVTDADWFDQLVVRGHRPALALVVDVEQVFFHCSKAFLRSGLWDAASWRPDAVESRARIAHRLERPDTPLADLEAYYGPSYGANLYR
jgi:PPOX class probable FMN-dependent enzyme